MPANDINTPASERNPSVANPSRVSCYFITGTGRCGTMLLSKVLSCGYNTHCNHEHSVPTLTMKDAYFHGDYNQLNEVSVRTIENLVSEYGRAGKSYGECSSHLFPVIPALHDRFGSSTRFVLLVRRPDAFVRSALARGFFDPSHPKPCEHVRPNPATEIGAQWTELTPFDKCLWYWNMVNSAVLDTFDRLPAGLAQVVRMEDLNLSKIDECFSFFGIDGFTANGDQIRELMGIRINASPGQGDDRSLNPWSQEISLPGIETWTTTQRDALVHWAGPLARKLYPEWMQQTF